MRIYGVTGWKNSGKTGLVERLVSEISGRGFTVSTIKHAHHATEIDHPGRDSYRHREAGAREVLVASPVRWALMHELRDQPEPPIEELLQKLSPVDLILVEGYKREAHPKVEAHRSETGRGLLATTNETIKAIASDSAVEADGLPVFDLDDTASIADFILGEVGL
ncbi:molybdopterin-guanine dinucleotide biosynthesis protein B [Actibacterium pelagium]|uniref:Molybdopterin-guanine dinucleotide biosynthesis protein MobB n=1 Tax=Actibacterium pelagium TaxID=2029103 RepID=A0A917AHC0_9RHOB|nr:molybdopterin-guanine dinucleotide biosynthesis protein B [Actibacterium pelagium]GGE48516.1 molybdopterin-guanine dinucleotide biosynthesis protein MobB [Actibacterium pelagium]